MSRDLPASNGPANVAAAAPRSRPGAASHAQSGHSRENVRPDASDPGNTRQWIIRAFDDLLAASQDYSAIRVADIVGDAGVGRSTFYEHFRNKDDVLRHAMSHILATLADAAGAAADARRIELVLEHFRDFRSMCLAMMRDQSFEAIRDALAELINDRMAQPGASGTVMPRTLIARQVAAAQFALIADWLHSASMAVSAATIAQALIRTSRAMAESLGA